jgi:hypothetical protein
MLVSNAFPLAARAATLRPTTIQAWDRCFRWADAKVVREVKDTKAFLIQDHLASQDRE